MRVARGKGMAAMARIAACVLLATAGGAAWGQWWNPASPIAPGKWAAMGQAFVYTSAVQEQASLVIRGALHDGDFDKLDRMHDEFVAMLEAGGNGKQMLESFTDAPRGSFGGERPEQYAKLFTDWAAQRPESKLRPAMEAAMWSAQAWRARGGGYASEVSPEALEMFRARLARAARVLEESQAQARHSPLWYWIAISVGGAAGAPPQALDGLFDEAAAKFPLFMPLYAARLNFLLPQWGGDYGRVDAFIRRAVARTQATEGTSLYAMLYQGVHSTYRGEDFFRETKASWRLMKHGFEDQVAQGTVDLKRYATYACMARDRDTTRQLLAQLGDGANLGAGMEGFTTEACAELVREGR